MSKDWDLFLSPNSKNNAGMNHTHLLTESWLYGFSNLNRFVTTSTSIIYFSLRFVTTLIPISI